MDNENTNGNNVRRNSKSVFSGLNQRNVVIGGAALVIIIFVLMIVFLRGNHIAEIQKFTQTVNGAEAYTYAPVLEEKYNWEKASDSQRRKIAKAAVKDALEQAESENVGIYNIMGKDGDNVIFLYIKESNSVRISVNGEIKETVPL